MRANNLYARKEKETYVPRRQIEQLAREKLKLEDEILSVIQEQNGLNKAASHIQNLIRDARQKTRRMENEVTKVENENSELAVEVEKLRAELFKKTSMLSELEKRCTAQEKVLEEQLKDIQQSDRVIRRKTAEVEKLTRKLNKTIQEQGVRATRTCLVLTCLLNFDISCRELKLALWNAKYWSFKKPLQKRRKKWKDFRRSG